VPVDQIAKRGVIALPGAVDQLGVGHTIYRHTTGGHGWNW